jgi:hypothetical protein
MVAKTALRYHTQQIHYHRLDIDYTMDGETKDIGIIPAGAQILKAISGVHVNTAFNGGTTNTLDIGPSTDSGTNLWGTLLALGTTTFVPLDEAVGMSVAVDTLVQCKVVSTASASAGAGVVILAFIPPLIT